MKELINFIVGIPKYLGFVMKQVAYAVYILIKYALLTTVTVFTLGILGALISLVMQIVYTYILLGMLHITPAPEKLPASELHVKETVTKVIDTYKEKYNEKAAFAAYLYYFPSGPNVAIHEQDGKAIILIDPRFIKGLNDNQLAAIIGHEIGHFHFAHTKSSIAIPFFDEARSDAFGLDLAARAGYNGCEISNFWYEAAQYTKDMDKEIWRIHPPSILRYLSTKC